MATASLLIVDDEQDFARILARRLERHGYLCQTAFDAASALAQLQPTIDLIILDAGLPDRSGLEVLQAIKLENPLYEVILLTGQGTVSTAVAAIREGAFAYLLKPCELEDLLETISKALIRRQQRETRILEIRMTPYLTPEKREELIAAVIAQS